MKNETVELEVTVAQLRRLLIHAGVDLARIKRGDAAANGSRMSALLAIGAAVGVLTRSVPGWEPPAVTQRFVRLSDYVSDGIRDSRVSVYYNDGQVWHMSDRETGFAFFTEDGAFLPIRYADNELQHLISAMITALERYLKN